MKRLLRIRLIAASFLAMLLSAFLPSIAFSAEPAVSTNLMERVAAFSDTILIGKVVATDAHWSADRRHIVTDVHLAVLQVVKGPPNTLSYVITNLGGTVGDVTEEVSDRPTFVAGEIVAVFVSFRDSSIVGGKRGKLVLTSPSLRSSGRQVDTQRVFQKLSDATGVLVQPNSAAAQAIREAKELEAGVSPPTQSIDSVTGATQKNSTPSASEANSVQSSTPQSQSDSVATKAATASTQFSTSQSGSVSRSDQVKVEMKGAKVIGVTNAASFGNSPSSQSSQSKIDPQNKPPK